MLVYGYTILDNNCKEYAYCDWQCRNILFEVVGYKMRCICCGNIYSLSNLEKIYNVPEKIEKFIKLCI